MSDWPDSKLWVALSSRSDEHALAVRGALEQCMPTISDVLRHAGTAPSDFTLHDDQHSLRVVERMADLIPDDGVDGLSAYELALLILSAFLHDIGLTPDRELVARHYKYVLTGEDMLGSEDGRSFRLWLDEYGRGAVPPLLNTTEPESALSQASQLVTRYCREKHAEWSIRWIDTNLGGISLGAYSNWLADLRALCLSHNEGRDSLVSPALAPRLVAPGTVVNLRYLACLLRVADVMEIDPERTPPVVFRQRGVSHDSAIYWHKDHEMVLDLHDASISLTARPPSAPIHRAIIMTADQIDAELRLSRDLADRGSFAHCVGYGDLPHAWPWPGLMLRDIEPLDGAYEYIDGDFRPDTDRILELLAGVALYQTPMAAVREALQNAADAVSEQMARVRLSWGEDACAADRVDALRETNIVELSIEHRDGYYWLDCKDTGVGMTKSIITKQLLVSGSSHGGEVMELKRRAQEAGFAFHRTGRFGVGVLSYFMLADEIRIKTERSSEAEGAEGCGWEFVSEGIESFGELRRLPPGGHGTTVSLRLRQAIIEDEIGAWLDKLNSYLDGLLVSMPCKMRVRARDDDATSQGPGWCRSTRQLGAQLTGRAVTGAYLSDGSLLPDRELRRFAEEIAQNNALKREFESAMCFDERIGELDDGLGRYRITVPYFDLVGGLSFAYMRTRQVDTEIEVQRLEDSDAWLPGSTISVGWNGMSVAIGAQARRRAGLVSIEVDFTGDAVGDLAVNRLRLNLRAEGRAAIERVERVAQSHITALVDQWSDSAYDSLNRCLAGLSFAVERSQWLSVDGELRRWARVHTPAISSADFPYNASADAQIGDETIPVLPRVKMLEQGTGRPTHWWPMTPGPERMQVTLDGFHFVALWSEKRDGEAQHPLGQSSRFPHSMHDVLLFSETSTWARRVIWNEEHPVFQVVTRDALNWCEKNVAHDLNPLGVAGELLLDRARAAAWIALTVSSDKRLLWEAIAERDPGFLNRLWRMVFGLRAEARSDWPRVKVWHDRNGKAIFDVCAEEWITHPSTLRIGMAFPSTDDG